MDACSPKKIFCHCLSSLSLHIQRIHYIQEEENPQDLVWFIEQQQEKKERESFPFSSMIKDTFTDAIPKQRDSKSRKKGPWNFSPLMHNSLMSGQVHYSSPKVPFLSSLRGLISVSFLAPARPSFRIWKTEKPFENIWNMICTATVKHFKRIRPDKVSGYFWVPGFLLYLSLQLFSVLTYQCTWRPCPSLNEDSPYLLEESHTWSFSRVLPSLLFAWTKKLQVTPFYNRNPIWLALVLSTGI